MNFQKDYCIEFFENCGIEDKDIRDVIIKASEGVPYYLNLSVDTFEKIRIRKDSQFQKILEKHSQRSSIHL